MIRTIQVKHALVASSAAALVATAVGFLVAEAQVTPPAAAPALAALPGNTSISDVAERVVDGVVNVSSTQAVASGPASFDPFFTDPSSPFFGFGDRDPRMAQSMGSGVIVSAGGRVLTNAHVIKGADTITVTLHDGSDHKARVVGTDPKADLAVLQLEGKFPPLRPLPYGDSSKLRLGEVVLAVGNPFGVGQAVTMGIVSATGRAFNIAQYEDFIQTDAAINPGNSGGALVNLRGELIGINTAILSRSGGYQGIGFAIPSNMARSIADMLVKDGRVSRGLLGVHIAPLGDEIAGKLKVAPRSGVLIAQVEPSGPAAKAGLTDNTIVTAIDGLAVNDPGKLRNLIAMAGGNRDVTLAVIQDGKPRTLKVKLGEVPDEDQVIRTPRRLQRSPGRATPGRRAPAPRAPAPDADGSTDDGQPDVRTWGEQIIVHPDGTVERRKLP
jgi:Do/DeqQ family serine protease